MSQPPINGTNADAIREEMDQKRLKTNQAMDRNTLFEQRKAEFSTMAARLKEIEAVRNVIPYQEFLQFIPLFQQTDEYKNIMRGDEKWEQLHELSMRFYRRFSIFDEIKVTFNDEVVMVLPPVANRPRELDNSLVDLTTAFHNVIRDDAPQEKQRQVVMQLQQAIWTAQSAEEVAARRTQFEQLATKVMQIQSKFKSEAPKEDEDVPATEAAAADDAEVSAEPKKADTDGFVFELD